MLNYARCDLLAPIAVKAARGLTLAVFGFVLWLLAMPIVGFAAMALQRLLTGVWPWPAKVMFLGLGAALGLI